MSSAAEAVKARELRGEVVESAKRIYRKPDRNAKRAVARRQFNQFGDGIRDFFWIQRRRGEPLKKFLGSRLQDYSWKCGRVERLHPLLLKYWKTKNPLNQTDCYDGCRSPPKRPFWAWRPSASSNARHLLCVPRRPGSDLTEESSPQWN
jgi:hypothetical protein